MWNLLGIFQKLSESQNKQQQKTFLPKVLHTEVLVTKLTSWTYNVLLKFFNNCKMRHWPRLTREAVDTPSLQVFKDRLDGAVSSLGWWKLSLLMAGGWTRLTLKTTFKHKSSYDLPSSNSPTGILAFKISTSMLSLKALSTAERIFTSILINSSATFLPYCWQKQKPISQVQFVYIGRFVSIHTQCSVNTMCGNKNTKQCFNALWFLS